MNNVLYGYPIAGTAIQKFNRLNEEVLLCIMDPAIFKKLLYASLIFFALCRFMELSDTS